MRYTAQHNLNIQILISKIFLYFFVLNIGGSMLSYYIKTNQQQQEFKKMQQFIQDTNAIRQRVDHGASMCPPKQYPFMLFKCGLLYNRLNDINKVFSFLETIEYLRAENRLTNTLQGHLLSFLYQNPETYNKIKEVLDKLLQGKPVNILLQLQKIQQLKLNSVQTSQTINGNANSQNKQNLTRNGTMMMQQNNNEHPDVQDNASQKTQKYDEQYFQNVQKMNLQSQALAKKLQEQEQMMVKNAPADDQIFCQVCYVGLYEEQFIPLEGCQHIFHKNCLSEYFKEEISLNRFPLKCPNDKCKIQLNDRDIKQVLATELYQKYQKHTLKHYADMHGDSISWCPTADCEYMFFFEKDDNPRFQCLECKKQYCLNCRVQWHKDMSCKEYQISNTHNADDDAFMKFVKGKKFKQCPKCKFWVEKNQGCDHMTCKCKFQFCYKCGGVYMKCQCVAKMQQQIERRRAQIAQKRKKREQMISRKKAKKVPQPPVAAPTGRTRRRK